jgi:hypothetical protein
MSAVRLLVTPALSISPTSWQTTSRADERELGLLKPETAPFAFVQRDREREEGMLFANVVKTERNGANTRLVIE